MRIAVVSFYYYSHDYWCNYDILNEYCTYNSYDLFYSIKQVEESNIHSPTYDGMVFMRQLLDREYDLVFWLDATDIILLNNNIRLETLISDQPINFSNDVITSNPVKIYECNSGFWSVNSSNISKIFLDEVIDSYDHKITDRWSEEYWSDQNALNGVGESYIEFIDTNTLKQKYWFYNNPDFYNMDIITQLEYFGNQHKNSNIYRYGDFMIHFAGRVLYKWDIEKIYTKIKDEMARS